MLENGERRDDAEPFGRHVVGETAADHAPASVGVRARRRVDAEPHAQAVAEIPEQRAVVGSDVQDARARRDEPLRLPEPPALEQPVYLRHRTSPTPFGGSIYSRRKQTLPERLHVRAAARGIIVGA